MRIENETKYDYSDVLLRPKRSTLVSRKDVDLERELTFYHSKKKWKGIPILTANMPTTGTFEMAHELSKYKMITVLHKFYTIDDYKKFFKTFDNPDYIMFSIGIRAIDFENLELMIKEKLIDKFSFICLDVPNGYLQVFLDAVEKVRKLCPDHIIVAGNVVTNEATEEIILKGADIVKVGIGPGAPCTTRLKTGVGYPQLSATIECSDAAHGISNEQGFGHIIADGGTIHPSCIAKAFCGGAEFVMAGSQFSGFEQSGGNTVVVDGKKYKEYYGSSSNKAMQQHYGKKESYRASEGRETLLPHKGDIHVFIEDLLGSLRSTGTYIGARQLKEFAKRATFIKVNRQLNESIAKYDTAK